MDKIEAFFNRTALRINAISTVRLLLYLVGVFILWRFLTLDFVEKSGDAVWKWSFLRYYVMAGEWFPSIPDHHQARWGINLPVLLLLKIFGDAPWVYYIFPLLTALGTGIFLFLIAKELRSKTAGVIVFLLALVFPQTVRESTQFLPMLPAAFFALASAWFLLRHMKTGNLPMVFFSGLLIGISYGCKLTSLYWAAGFLLYLSLCPTEKRCFFRIWKFHFGPAVFLFGGGLLVVLVTETLLLNHFFAVKGGLIEIILGSHISNRVQPEYLNLFEYLFLSFIRPLDLSGKYFDFLPHTILLCGGIFTAIFLLFRGNRQERFLAVSFLAAYFFHAYVVYKFFPFLHPEKTHARYFLILAVFSMLLCAIGWKDVVSWLEERLPRRFVVIFLGFVIGFFVLLMLIRAGNMWKNGNHPITVLRTHSNLSTAKQANIPVLMKLRKKNQVLAGDMPTADYKYGNMWLTFWGPVEDLPKQNATKLLYLDEDGKLWQLLLNTAAFEPGKPERVLLLLEEASEFKTKTFSPATVIPQENPVR